MERIINKIIGSFRKKYFLITFIFAMIIIVMSGSYSYWSRESGWQKATELTYQSLSYSISINDTGTTTISSAANSGTVYYNVAITSINDINTKYLLVYNSSAAGLTISVSSMSLNNPVGIIGEYGEGFGQGKTRIVRIAVTNNTANASTITLNVLGGYTWNDQSSITIPNGYYAISGYTQESTLNLGLSLAGLVNVKTNCTPTASNPCYYSGNSNNYVSFDGDTWRILGSYIIGGDNVVKLILDTPLATPTTYSGTASSLSTFYSTISNTNFVRTASPFSCTGTTALSCSGSANIGLLSKVEHDFSEGSNTFLYTTPDKYYWTNTESSTGIYYVGTNKELKTLSGTSTAYVKPTIYLNKNIVAIPGTEGTQSNPYTLGYGYYATVTKNKAFTNLVSGYYAKETAYSIGTILNPTYYAFDSSVTGAGSSLNTTNNTFTMGTENASVTMNWWAKYTIVYNCNGLTGSTSSSNHVENVAQNLTTNGCVTFVTGSAGKIYNFLGWNTNSGATTATYTNAQSVTGLTSTGGATITLYAIYQNYFTYSGVYNLTGTASDWKITITSTGSFVNAIAMNIDIFLVGGGGGGGAVNSWSAGGGGAGGYTLTQANINLSASTNTLTVGTAVGNQSNGNASSAFGYSAGGGNRGSNGTGSLGGAGGAGGSGGGGGGSNQSASNGGTGGAGGSYGNRGSNNNRSGTQSQGGNGQGYTTCEFGAGSLSSCNNGVTYSGGGGGGAGRSSSGYGAAGANGLCSSGYGCGGRGQGTNTGYTAPTNGVIMIRNYR